MAAYVDYLEFVRPLIDRMLGLAFERAPPRVRARLVRRVPSRPGVRHFVRVRLRRAGGGLEAEPLAYSGSGILSSLTEADALLVIPEEVEGLPEGAEVEVVLLRPFLRGVVE